MTSALAACGVTALRLIVVQTADMTPREKLLWVVGVVLLLAIFAVGQLDVPNWVMLVPVLLALSALVPAALAATHRRVGRATDRRG